VWSCVSGLFQSMCPRFTPISFSFRTPFLSITQYCILHMLLHNYPFFCGICFRSPGGVIFPVLWLGPGGAVPRCGSWSCSAAQGSRLLGLSAEKVTHQGSPGWGTSHLHWPLPFPAPLTTSDTLLPVPYLALNRKSSWPRSQPIIENLFAK